MAIFVVLSAGVSAVAGWLGWERRRRRRCAAEVAQRHDVLEVRFAAALECHAELVEALEQDLRGGHRGQLAGLPRRPQPLSPTGP